jgi:phospholipid/cholesterol/gamma-HCH transport system ATP-binding protein
MTSVFDIGDKIIFIHDGKKWWEGKSNEIRTSGNIELLGMIEASGHEVD